MEPGALCKLLRHDELTIGSEIDACLSVLQLCTDTKASSLQEEKLLGVIRWSQLKSAGFLLGLLWLIPLSRINSLKAFELLI